MVKTTFELFLQMCGISPREFEHLPEEEKKSIIADFNAICELWKK